VYSCAPQLFIFGGFLQNLTGMDDYRDHTGDATGATLFRAGHYNAIAILPAADTGSWSRYSVGGPDSTLEQHLVLTDVLDSLCHRQGSPVYCGTAARFAGYTAARGG
jgi:D-glucuronyl C5-epimerase C-terminus